MATRRRTPDGNGDGNRDGSEDSSGDGNGDDDDGNGNKDRIGEGGREVRKRKKPPNSCRRIAGNGGDLGGKRKKNVEKKGLVEQRSSGRENKVLRAQVKIIREERVCPLCRA